MSKGERDSNPKSYNKIKNEKIDKSNKQASERERQRQRQRLALDDVTKAI